MTSARAIADRMQPAATGLIRRHGVNQTRIDRYPITHQFDPSRKVCSVGQCSAGRYSQLVGNERRVFRTDPEGDDRSCVADHRLAQKGRELAQELVRQNQRQPILTRFRQDRRKAVRCKVLELVCVESKVGAYVFWNIGTAFGGLGECSGEKRAQQMRWLRRVCLWTN